VTERVMIGIVRRTRGVHGELVVEPHTDLPDRFSAISQLYLVHGNEARTVTVKRVRRPKENEVWITLAEVTVREEAQKLNGATLEIDLTDRPGLPEGTYYHDELEGLDVVDTAGRRIGSLARVVPRGGQDLYVIDTGDGEALVPAVPAIVKSVDLKQRRIVIDPPAGLIE
jgi:16S rRNA processing protein RimM